MHGLIGKIIAIDGERDALIATLTGAAKKMSGCLSYVVAKDREDANAIWITEVWQDEASHSAVLKAPEVRNAIAKGKPLIAGFGERIVTIPVGGHGLSQTQNQ